MVGLGGRFIGINKSEGSMTYWCENDPVRTHFYDGCSILFPAWENAFVCVALHYKNKVTDENLKARIDQFCKQEISHANAHKAHNKVHELDDMEIIQTRKAKVILRRPGHQMWLATMVSIEHIAACGARNFLKRYKNKSSKEVNLYKWHSKEELEHKSLAMDLWLYFGKSRLALKKIAILNALYVFKSILNYTILKCIEDKILWKASTIKSLIGLGYELIFKFWIPYLNIFKNNFHPNKTDDSKWLMA